jgi:hypothetical protein
MGSNQTDIKVLNLTMEEQEKKYLETAPSEGKQIIPINLSSHGNRITMQQQETSFINDFFTA